METRNYTNIHKWNFYNTRFHYHIISTDSGFCLWWTTTEDLDEGVGSETERDRQHLS